MEKFCVQCGEKLPEGAGFCKKCGAAAPASENTSAAGETEKPQGRTEKRGRKIGKGKTVAVAAAAVAVILAASIVIFLNSDGHQYRKNLMLAEEAYEAEDYEEALFYYEEALYFDDTIADVYLKPAEIYLVEKDYDKAAEMLENGLERISEEEESREILREKLVEVNLGRVDFLLANDDYENAKSKLRDGIEKTEDVKGLLREKMIEVYAKEADLLLSGNDYEKAEEILKEGKKETGDAAGTLNEKLSNTYRKEAEDFFAAKDYVQAAAVLREGQKETGDSSLEEFAVERFLTESNRYLEAGDCLAAVEVLTTGVENNGAAGISEREEYVRENIIIAKEIKVEYDNFGNIHEQEIHYNNDGNITKEIETVYHNSREEASVSSWTETEFVYDGQGKKLNATCTYDFGSKHTYMTYEYDSLGNMAKLSYYTDDGLWYWYEYEYDEQGNERKEIKYTGKDLYTGENLSSVWTEYEYDSQGNKLKEKTYNKEGEPIVWSEYEYDAQGNERKELRFDETGNIEDWYEMAYDEQGNRQKQKYYVGNGELRVCDEYEYDEYGNMTGDKQLSADDAILGESTWKYSYNVLGNVLDCCEFYKDNYYDSEAAPKQTRNWQYEYEYAYIGEL